MIDANSVAQGAMANGFSQGQAMQMAQQAMMDNAMLGMMQQMEQAVDDEMDRFENMTEEDLAKIRANRIKEMKQKAEQKQEWKNNGHGGMTRITDQKDFFAVTKQSERVVCLFNRESNRWGKVMKEHLTNLAARHLEARFVEIDAENAPFITDKLNIYMLPTICCIKGNKVHKQHNGLDEIDGTGKYSTGMLEYLLHTDEMLDEAPLYEEEKREEEEELAELDLDD